MTNSRGMSRNIKEFSQKYFIKNKFNLFIDTLFKEKTQLQKWKNEHNEYYIKNMISSRQITKLLILVSLLYII